MRRLLLTLCVLAFGAVPAAQAEKRIALVIGNSAYQNTTELKNPRSDALDMAAALRRLGFDVLDGRDLDKRSMERLIRQFGVKLSGADLAFFFYGGHGVAINGQNYLVPTDARLGSEGDADFEALPLSLVLKQMEREAKTSIVLLDACRDNPLARNLARNMGTRSSQVGQGLAEVRTGVGTLIGFSTQPGNVATDGAGRNSPYAEALLRHMEVPGKDVSGVLIAVRNHVLKETGGRQVPWEHTSLTGQVYLRLDAVPPPGAAIPSPAPNYDREIELSYWNSVKDSKSPAMLESYLERYPYGNFSGLARAMLDQLKATAAPPPTGGPTPGPKADSPKAAAPPGKAKSASPPPRPARKTTGSGKAGGGGMCWGSDGRNSVVVPCSDSRAGPRAY
jgi:Caspase domain